MRVTRNKIIYYLGLVLVSLTLLGGCDEGPAENAGEEIDNAVENGQDSLDDAQEQIEESVDQ